MPSTFRHNTASTALILLGLALSARGVEALSAITPEGCYSASAPLQNQGSYLYQTTGYCQPLCVNQSLPVMALTGGDTCYCGSELPTATAKVDSSNCNSACVGYPSDTCGGLGFYQVYLTGLEDTVPTYSGSGSGSSSSGSGSSSSGSSSSSPSSTHSPSVVTKVSPQTTVVITHEASSTPTQTVHSNSSHGTSTAGIAAGVVVALVVVGAIIAGVFFYLRHRKRKAAEEEYKRAQVAEIMRGGERKPPTTGYSSTSDSRLEPASFNGRRNSIGSIADNEDYSRKILRVANPDRSSIFPPDRASIFPPNRAYHP